MTLEFSDEILMAYADGELSGEVRARVAKALAGNAALQARIAAFEATRDPLQRAFAPVLAADIPKRLLAAIRQTPMPMPATAGGMPSGGRSAKRFTAFVGSSLFDWLRPGLALAAALAMGVGLGVVSQRGVVGGGGRVTASGELIAVIGGQLRARGELARALETAPSGSLVADAGAAGQPLGITPVATFRSHDNAFCRQYEMQTSANAGFAGFACRGAAGEWTIQMHTPVKLAARGPAGTYAPASRRDASPALEAAISTMARGDVLLQDDEAKARAAGWK